MHCEIKIDENLYWIGANDRRIALFENVYPVPDGVSYNSYFIDDEKTAVLDTVDASGSKVFFENLEHLLDGRKPDYLIINHTEPDHAATVALTAEKYPEIKLVCNAKTAAMLGQFFENDFSDRLITVKEGDTLSLGKHTLTFVMAPMVHWPEVMVTYETSTKTLFSADAFGVFGALSGNIFADETDFDISEARRYYTNIVGKYGAQVQSLLKKASALEINRICPLHGPVHRKDIGILTEKYDKWSSYTPEDTSVAVFYASVYGNTENAAEILTTKLAAKGIKNIKLYDVSATHPSYLVAEAFRCSHLVFAAITYNAGIFVNMENLLHDLVSHNIQNRTVSFIENGSWAPTSASMMKKILEPCKNMTFIEDKVTVKSSLKQEQYEQIEKLADEVYNSMSKA